MEDKEKKILIKLIDVPCNGCSGAGENVCDNCCDWDMWNSCFTREQAIYKIAKAIEENLNGSSYKSLAEAALNSLLGAEK